MRSIFLAFIFISTFVSAQVTDSFTDGDFTANPVWSGDAEFIINASNQLQLNNTVAGASYLSTPNTLSSLDNMEWHFYIKQSFAPSGSNYGRVYLVSDQANLEGSLNGYYLQFGEAGSLDAVELFKQTGLTSTSICRGTSAQIAATFTLGIKVTRNASGLWSLYVDATGGTSYSLQATGTDITYTTTNYFGVATVYTGSNSTKFYFDDFYVGAIIVDNTPPTIVSSTVISNTQVDVLFSENVDATTSQTLTNYSADNGLGNPSVATRDASNFSLVHLTFATSFTDGLNNILTVTNVQDLNSNAITTATTNFTYVAPVVPAYKDIIINEIFADPTPQVHLPLVEYIELYNKSSKTLNLNGWKFTDGSSTATLGNYVLPPNQYLIVCNIADTALFTTYGNRIGVSSFPSLNNTGDNLKLEDNTLTVIDSVDYSDAWYQDAIKKGGGWSLELINPNAPIACPATGNWIASIDTIGGTPGKINSVYSTAPDVVVPVITGVSIIDSTHITVCFSEAIDVSQINVASNYTINNGIGTPQSAIANTSFTCVDLTLNAQLILSTTYTLTMTNLSDCSGNALNPTSINFTYAIPSYKDIIINEIFADPTPAVHLPEVEFIEIYNRGVNAFNVNGWKLTDGSSTATLSSFTLGAGQYLIICPIGDTTLYSPYGNRMGVSSFPSLNNSGDNLKLKDNTFKVIDSVDYLDAWYGDAIKKDGGWTLELINPNAPTNCPSSNNWKASNDTTGGTPGKVNSIYSTAVDVAAPVIIGVTSNDSTHVTVCFNEAIDVSVINNISTYSINNGIGTPLSAVANSTYTCVELTLATALTENILYTITFTNVADCSGNPLATSTATFAYHKVKLFDVVINEIMADPDPIYTSLPNYEYVELHNRTPFAINLNNWTFSAGTNTKIIPDVTILPDSFIVFASTTAAPNYPASYNVVGVTSFPSLTNTGQTLTLKTPAGATISTVTYSDDWYQDTNKKEGGWSLEQIDPNNPCAGMNNWRASVSTDGGTPGRKNSVNATNADNSAPQLERVSVIAVDTIQVYFNEPLDSTTMLNPLIYTIDNGIGAPTQVKPIAPDFKSVRLALASALQKDIIYTITVNSTITDCVGNPIATDNTAQFAIPDSATTNDIVINEILYNPKDGGVDFVEIYNRSNKIIDLKTITLSQFDTVTNALVSIKNISNDGYLLFPQNYLVLSQNGNSVKNQYYTSNPKGFLNLPSMISMSIASGTVCLATSTTIIDKLIYYDNMQFALLNSSKGVSLERIDFNRPTQDMGNWHSAAEAVGYGTPAYKNSQYNDAGETDGAIEVTPELFSPDEDGKNDIVNINYHFDTPGFVANVTIYDSNGRLVKQLIRNELLGTKGTFTWDGITDAREKARIGIYILFVEVFDLSGKVKHYKKTCVLAGKL